MAQSSDRKETQQVQVPSSLRQQNRQAQTGAPAGASAGPDKSQELAGFHMKLDISNPNYAGNFNRPFHADDLNLEEGRARLAHSAAVHIHIHGAAQSQQGQSAGPVPASLHSQAQAGAQAQPRLHIQVQDKSQQTSAAPGAGQASKPQARQPQAQPASAPATAAAAVNVPSALRRHQAVQSADAALREAVRSQQAQSAAQTAAVSGAVPAARSAQTAQPVRTAQPVQAAGIQAGSAGAQRAPAAQATATATAAQASAVPAGQTSGVQSAAGRDEAVSSLKERAFSSLSSNAQAGSSGDNNPLGHNPLWHDNLENDFSAAASARRIAPPGTVPPHAGASHAGTHGGAAGNASQGTADRTRLTANGDDPDLVPRHTTWKDDEVPNTPGAILCHAREMLGISQREVAARLHLRVNSISDIEHDRLNQPTAAAFVRKHIAHYAILVGIDPDTVVNLYDQNVLNLRAISAVNTRKQRSRRRKIFTLKRVVYGLIFAGIAAGLALNFLSGQEPSEADNAPVTISGNQSSGGTVLPAADTVSGSLSDQAVSQEQPATDRKAAPAAHSAPDLNTQRALAQAEALGTNELTEEDLHLPPKADTSAPLYTSTPSAEHTSSAAADAQSTAPAAERAGSNAAVQEEPAWVSEAPLPPQVRNERAAPSQSAAQAQPERAGTAAQVQQPQRAETDRQIVDNRSSDTSGTLTIQQPAGKPELSSRLKNISGSVSVPDRDGLASLNSAVITVKGDVALKVTGNGRTIASGVYKAGNSIRVTAVPPIEIQVSDTSKISVSYMGGTLRMPADTQVRFTLPQR